MQASNVSLTRDSFNLFRRPNENNQENSINNTNNNNNTNTNNTNNNTNNSNNTNNNTNNSINNSETNRNLGFNLDNILVNRRTQSTNSHREAEVIQNNTNNAQRITSDSSDLFSHRPAFFEIFTETTSINNSNNLNIQDTTNCAQNSDKNNDKSSVVNKENVEIEETISNKTNNINTNNKNNTANNTNNNPPLMPNRSLLKNEASPPFLNLNENSDSESQFLGKKRENELNIVSENSVNNNFESHQRNITNNSNDDENGDDNRFADNFFPPILAPEIEMIIEEYTEQDEDDSRSYNVESCNYTESENNINNNNNNNNQS